MSSDVKHVCEEAGIAKNKIAKRNHGEKRVFECWSGLMGSL